MRRVVVGLAVLVGLVLVAGCADPNADACRAAGGVVKEKYDTGVGVNPSGGGPVVTVSTTYFCLVDGQVTDIW